MRVILSGGGTGGHIYPALALSKVIKEHEPDSEFLYVGSLRGVEANIVPKTGMAFDQLEIQGFRRSLSFDNFKTLYFFLKAVHRAKKIIRDFKPDVVIGTGGYVSGAVVYAAQALKIPTVIHEQNSVAGITNRFLARKATRIGLAFQAAESQFPSEKTRLVGNPRAQEVAGIQSDFSWTEIGLTDNQPTLLIFGGSQGAPAINKAVLQAMSDFNQRSYQTVIVTGPKRFDSFQTQLKELNITPQAQIKILPYIDNMPAVLAKTAAIVARAGATSLAEITALGIPSILIPSPYVTGDHQRKNAQSLVEAGAALMITEDQLSEQKLMATVDQIMLDQTMRADMAKKAAAIGEPQAGEALYRLVLDAMAE
ncbi:undecaprenyldiphospho-muramoylpentapeptide beta-N-acetylglucosaminyltransferase [Convivina intestini]|uniref:UDP-N-acetylglucosamine--N-acetylmuramyl-(pentapeptide) pyrophosphoryl-undecaprenol N-acetylglucosamine transferase n=1 Tax=Convivina intestini TaxID=1505726 RepID=A0A2U1D912_9LACO|nr:undecaprenyldiphospho-muramoylpentapeptide beta-N-acetylglucosaminyltransferase [Convivina intestini]PVY84165.1 UDP-N-acetylglucosamine-N-acetylmuramylpentapeptide N-acetylglucosamine transferase [Convivina intestini]CAH1854337.1 UDP-N-acetylglucosamine--N-acetylmuramyl-(pentapeptide) pyrophosphoryl-undecaprenol N-acetylglucosamine transferase [Convivina intestini]SDB91112.1 UDP-N-acetylglucosamine-N-acetylmuramylpentapeptide N-acetylglucosamine transferase [Leuconostocaceae bacterium R-53105